MANMFTFPRSPLFCGKASFFAGRGQQVISRNRIAPNVPGSRVANKLLSMTDTARRNCGAIIKDHSANDDGVQHAPRIFRERLAPGAIDAIYREVAKFLIF